MQALEIAIKAKIPGSPASRTKCELSLTSVSDIEARTSKGRPTIPAREARPPRIVSVPVEMRAWIDLTNSPHVLVMRPVIECLRADGHDVRVTARDFAQTIELCERLGIAHAQIGRHRGGRLGAKALGLASRSGALVRWARAEQRAVGRFDIALGHGSNDVSIAAAVLRIPSATMFDYEWATVQHNVNCRLAAAVVVPDAIGAERLWRYGARGKVRAYEGLKEEYYLADFEPEDAVLGELGLDGARPIVVVRTPPVVSLYHRFENDLFAVVLRRLSAAAVAKGVQPVVLPRVASQREELVRLPGLIVPERAIDAQSLIAYADVVISAGGTMNREAVALGTPVYTTFQGRLGAVDERLIGEGRLRMLTDADELDLGARERTVVPARVRRDPRLLVDLLLSPVRG
jgi:predicted glycosyltransferase